MNINEDEFQNSFEGGPNDLKIEIYPEKSSRYSFLFEEKPITNLLNDKTLSHSLTQNQKLYNTDKNVPLLTGYYTAHISHHPIRIKPDDIWLLIIQAFSIHVNSNSEKLRHYFVNFSGKKTLTIKTTLSNISEVDKEMLEHFSEEINIQIKDYVGEELVNILTSDFSTTTFDLSIISKITIMGTFKEYFDYEMDLCGCGIPYIILEGTAEDYKKIIEKAKYLAKYEFDWYINRIIPHIQKMVDAKEGNVDIEYFQDMIQKKEVTEIRTGLSGLNPHEVKVDYVCGWLLSFFAYYDNNVRFDEDTIEVENFNRLPSQMLAVPFKIIDQVHKLNYDMEYKVGFVGCSMNKHEEVYPVQAWFVNQTAEKYSFKNRSSLHSTIIPPKGFFRKFKWG